MTDTHCALNTVFEYNHIDRTWRPIQNAVCPENNPFPDLDQGNLTILPISGGIDCNNVTIRQRPDLYPECSFVSSSNFTLQTSPEPIQTTQPAPQPTQTNDVFTASGTDVFISYAVTQQPLAGLDSPLGGDEIKINAQIKNNSSVTKEYRVFVYNPSGALLDKEPDFSWKNASAGQSINIAVNSQFDLSWSINDVFPSFRVRVFEQSEGLVAERLVYLNSGEIKDTQPSLDDTQNPDIAPPVDNSTGTNVGNESGQPYTPGNGNGSGFGDSVGTIFENLPLILGAVIVIQLIGAFK